MASKKKEYLHWPLKAGLQLLSIERGKRKKIMNKKIVTKCLLYSVNCVLGWIANIQDKWYGNCKNRKIK